MSKRLKNPDQIPLLAVPSVDVGPFKAALVSAIKSCPLSREQIADRMSLILGKGLSVHEINTWTAQSKDRHLPRADELIAFVQVTGRPEPLAAIAAEARLTVIGPEDAQLLEIARLEEEKARINDRLNRLAAIRRGSRDEQG